MTHDTWVHFNPKCYFKKENVEQDKGNVMAILMVEIIPLRN